MQPAKVRSLYRDTAAIIHHLNPLHATGQQINVDALRPRIDGIFQQFLEHRGWTLDDLTGRNLVDQVRWQLLYGQSSIRLAQRRAQPRASGRRSGH